MYHLLYPRALNFFIIWIGFGKNEIINKNKPKTRIGKIRYDTITRYKPAWVQV